MGASRRISRISLSVSVIRLGSAWRIRIRALPSSLVSLLVLLSSFRVVQRRDFAAAHLAAGQPVQSGATSDSRPLASLNLAKSAATEEPTSFLNSIAELRNEEENYLINQASSSPALSFQRNFQHDINIREANQTRLNESSAALHNGDNESDCGPNGESFGPRQADLAKSLARHYNVQSNTGGSRPIKEGQPPMGNSSAKLRDLPRPVNISVLIISWYPPILKLSWNLNELNEAEASKLNFYQNAANQSIGSANGSAGLNQIADRTKLNASSSSSAQDDKFLASQFDLELAIEGQPEMVSRAGSGGSRAADNVQEELEFNQIYDEDQERLVGEIRARRRLIEESLTCFQVTYNIINSRFKVIEEYPPYFRSIMLERLLPATEYSLRVVAVYLGKYKLQSDRVQFVSPTDNESRRFKENTYRPIHRYPDEKSELRIGLAQVRSEELTIVAIAIIFWIATICLFFNKWGKIRMLEPYQPAYREADAATFAHHHPSAHNLLNSVGSGSGATTGSGALVGIGAKMNSLCGGPPGLMGVACPSGSFIGSGTLGAANIVPASAILSDPAPASLNTAKDRPDQQPRERSSEGTLAGRTNRNIVLLRGNKRYETTAADDDLPIATMRRTDAQLGYLFQSKALALAKATSMWTRQQQQQQSASGQPKPFKSLVAAELLEMGRTTSPARARLRQRGLSSGPLELDNPLDMPMRKRLLGTEVNRGHSVTSRGQMLKYHRQSQAIDLTGSSHLSKMGGARSLDRQASSQSGSTNPQADSPHHREPNWLPGRASLGGYGDQQQPAEYGPASQQRESANKLRRMLFTSKTHQHHHLATSTSSTTLINNASPNANPLTPANNLSSVAAGKINSASLDHETTSSSASGVWLERASGQQLADGVSWSSLPSDMAAAPAASATTGGPERGRRDLRSLAKLGPLQLRAGRTPDARQGPPPLPVSLAGEHHILIEPPSPPNRSGRSLVSVAAGGLCTDEDLSAASGAEPARSSSAARLEEGQPEELERGWTAAELELSVARERPLGEGNKSVGIKCRLIAARSQSGQQQPEEELFKEEEELLEGGERPCECRQIEIKPTAAVQANRRTVTNASGGSQDCQPDKMAASSQGCLSELNNCEMSQPFQPAIRFEEAQSEDSPSPSSAVFGSRQQLDSANDAFAKLASYQSQSGSAAARLSRDSRGQLSACAVGGAGWPSQQPAQLSHGGDYLLHQSFCAQAEHNHRRRRLLTQQQQRQLQLQSAAGLIHSAGSLCPDADCCLPAEEACPLMRPHMDAEQLNEQWQPNRPRMSSVFVASPYSRAHRDSFAMLRALSQKKSKSAEDVAYLSSLVLQIWVRDRNPLLQSASQQQLSARRQSSGLSSDRHRPRQRPKSSLTVAHI